MLREKVRASVLRVLEGKGIFLSRVPPLRIAQLELAIASLVAVRTSLNIVQIGANDGRINDPLFPILRKQQFRSKLLLVEPQAQLIPFLQENYCWHSNSVIANCAVGPDGHLTLFTVSERCWDHLKVPYARDWPRYRAPSGVASANREFVAEWLERYLPSYIAVDDMIEEIRVESRGLRSILHQYLFDGKIDLLQIDTESCDDEVIFASEVESLRPHLINFEYNNLSPARLSALVDFLHSQNYQLYPDQHSADMLAIAGPKEN
jgi:FkbM family methyltransferase